MDTSYTGIERRRRKKKFEGDEEGNDSLIGGGGRGVRRGKAGWIKRMRIYIWEGGGGGVSRDEMKSRACELCYLLAPLSWKTQLDPPFHPRITVRVKVKKKKSNQIKNNNNNNNRNTFIFVFVSLKMISYNHID